MSQLIYNVQNKAVTGCTGNLFPLMETVPTWLNPAVARPSGQVGTHYLSCTSCHTLSFFHLRAHIMSYYGNYSRRRVACARDRRLRASYINNSCLTSWHRFDCSGNGAFIWLVDSFRVTYRVTPAFITPTKTSGSAADGASVACLCLPIFRIIARKGPVRHKHAK